MRVTEQSHFASLVRRIQSHQGRLQEAVAEASTGVRVQRPSDDPLASAALQRLEVSAQRHQSYLRVQTTMQGQLETAESSLTSGVAVLGDALELALQMSSGAHTEESLQASAERVSLLKESLREIANTSHQGRYLFGGVADDQPPFDDAGGFQGSTTLRQVEIGEQQRISQLSGEDLFSVQGESLFAVLDELEGALAGGDQAGASATIDRLRGGVTSLTTGIQTVGNHLTTLEHARAFSEVIVLDAQRQSDRLEAADLADAASRIQMATTALQASAQAAQQVKGLKDLLFKL